MAYRSMVTALNHDHVSCQADADKWKAEIERTLWGWRIGCGAFAMGSFVLAVLAGAGNDTTFDNLHWWSFIVVLPGVLIAYAIRQKLAWDPYYKALGERCVVPRSGAVQHLPWGSRCLCVMA